jgi:hypothetical protein
MQYVLLFLTTMLGCRKAEAFYILKGYVVLSKEMHHARGKTPAAPIQGFSRSDPLWACRLGPGIRAQLDDWRSG